MMEVRTFESMATGVVRTAIGAMVLALASCGDDPDLVRKWEQQQVEIANLQKQYAVAQMKLKAMPRNTQAEIKRAEGELRKLEGQSDGLQEEIAALRQRKAEIGKEHAEYRGKYIIN